MLSYLALTQPNYSEKINHIRAAAAFWIFVFHYYHFIAHPFFTPLKSFNPFLLFIYHGYFCVYLFFVLSGFLLAKSYSQQLDLKSFFAKRIGRIFPAYYLCIAVYCLFFTTGLPDPKLLVTIFCFDPGIYPRALGYLWFINRLLECYLCFPLLWWILQKTGRAGLSVTYLCCLLGGGYWVLHNEVALPAYYFSLVLCLSHFILGMLAAYQSHTSKQLHKVAITILVFSSLLVWFHQSTWQTPLAYSGLSILWLNFIAVLFAVLIKAYLFIPIYLPYVISSTLQRIGKISYTFYLYHFLVILFFVLHRELLSPYNILNFLVLYFICIITAALFQQILTLLIRGVLYIKAKSIMG